MSERRVLVLFAHPSMHKSRVNRRLVDAIHAMDGVTFHDLYEAYPDFMIDVEREQELLLENDVIVFQHPFYWYSSPALMKEWLDAVLEHGFAYGHEGTALNGKWMMNAITTGGGVDAYDPNGFNRFYIKQLLAPFDQTAHLCGMTYLAPFAVHGTFRLKDDELESHAREYRDIIQALRDNAIDVKRAQECARLNEDLSFILTKQ